MSNVEEYLNSNCLITKTLDVSELVDRTIKYWGFINNAVNNKKLLEPSYHINTEDTNDPYVYIYWNKGVHHLTLEIYENYDRVVYDYQDETDSSKTWHDHWKIDDELEDYIVDILLLFTED